MLLLVQLVRGHVFGGSETRGGARVGVALCDLWRVVSALCVEGKRGTGKNLITLVALFGSSRHGTLNGLGGLVDGVPGRPSRSGYSVQAARGGEGQ